MAKREVAVLEDNSPNEKLTLQFRTSFQHMNGLLVRVIHPSSKFSSSSSTCGYEGFSQESLKNLTD